MALAIRNMATNKNTPGHTNYFCVLSRASGGNVKKIGKWKKSSSKKGAGKINKKG